MGKQMDEADVAEMEEQRARDRALSVRKPVLILPAMGECYNCRSIVPSGVRWCDCDCRADWELRNGRA